jgi:integrase
MAGAETAIVVSPGERPVDLLIALWLDEKFNRSRSERTRRAYGDTIAAFRSYVRSAGHDVLDTDLLKPPPEEAGLGSQEDLLRMAGMAGLVQEFVDSPKRDGTPVALSTRNQWLAILSSFYAFAEKRGKLVGVSNPIKQVERSKVQSYARATPLKAEAVQEVLAGIDRRQPMGLRDYALLAIGFSTGRRLAELAALRWGDVLEEQNGSVKVTLTFPHTKGGKVMRDTLPHAVGQVLLEYKQARITDQVMLRPEDPVWVSYSSNRTSTARALHPTASAKSVGGISPPARYTRCATPSPVGWKTPARRCLRSSSTSVTPILLRPACIWELCAAMRTPMVMCWPRALGFDR